ncbi:hypothetical protein Bbelb_320800 [Branchiostoma belcheri]|nr:hypothetical protein Bbelb_320800 [Branchiostoma belcheri]
MVCVGPGNRTAFRKPESPAGPAASHNFGASWRLLPPESWRHPGIRSSRDLLSFCWRANWHAARRSLAEIVSVCEREEKRRVPRSDLASGLPPAEHISRQIT